MTFQTQDVTLEVSRIDANGFWLGNSQEHVSKGTALGAEFTENVYTPTEEGLIGKYDAESDTWTEIQNRALDEYWNDSGAAFVIGSPDGEFPEWAIQKAPPEYDADTQTVLYKDGVWYVYEIQLGRKYWNSEGVELIVSEYNFELPADHTWTEPPVAEDGFVMRLVDDEWVPIADHRGQTIYNTDTQESKQVETVGDIEEGWTIEAPLSCSVWDGSQWTQMLALMVEDKLTAVNIWRDEQEADESRILTVNGVDWDAGPSARSRIESTLAAVEFIPTFWTDANNVDQTIDKASLQAIHTAIVAFGFELHARQREMKTEIAALTTIAAVDAYQIDWAL